MGTKCVLRHPKPRPDLVVFVFFLCFPCFCLEWAESAGFLCSSTRQHGRQKTRPPPSLSIFLSISRLSPSFLSFCLSLSLSLTLSLSLSIFLSFSLAPETHLPCENIHNLLKTCFRPHPDRKNAVLKFANSKGRTCYFEGGALSQVP